MPTPVVIDVYLHASHDMMEAKGQAAGMAQAAIDHFVYALDEVKLTLEVDAETGTVVRILAVNDRRVADE